MRPSVREQLDRLVDQARRQLDCGQAGSACDLAARVIREQPGHIPARITHAEALLTLNRPHEATQTLDAADLYAQESDVALDRGQKIQAMLLRAEAMSRSDDLAGARKLTEKVLQIQPGHPRALQRLAGLLMEADEPDRAIPFIKRLLTLRPFDMHVLRMLADAYERINLPEEALLCYDQLDAVDRDRDQRLSDQLRSARLRRLAERVPDAMDAYARLLAEEPNDPALACEAAELAAELGDDERVMQFSATALGARRDYGPAIRIRAQQHMRSGRFAQAGRAWWQLWRSDATNVEAMAGLMVAALCDDHQPLATRIARRMDKAYNRTRRQNAIAAMWRLATPGRVIEQLWRRSGAMSNNRVLPCLLDEAAESLELAIDSRPQYADLHYHLSVCQRELGHDDLAAESLDRALQLNRGYVAAARSRIELLLSQSCLVAADALIEATESATRSQGDLFDLSLVSHVLAGRSDEAGRRLVEQASSSGQTHAIADRVAGYLERFQQAAGLQAWNAARHRHLTTSDPTPTSKAA